MRRKGKIDIKKLVSWAGTLLMLVSLGFIARRFMVSGMDFSLLTSPWIVAGLFAVALGEGLVMVSASVNFRALVKNVSGVAVARPLAMVVYLISNLYKYIPGGVMYVAGRHRMAVETEALSHSKLVFATISEGAFTVTAAIILALALSFEHSLSYVRQLGFLPLLALILGLALIGAVPPLYLLRHKISAALKRFWATVEILRPAVLVKRLGFALMLMFLWGVTFLAVLALLGQPITAYLAPTIIGLYLLAWLAGFLTPGAPSGLGIREAVMLMFLGGLVYESILLAAMVIHRAVTMVGDVSAYGMALGYEKLSTRERSL